MQVIKSKLILSSLCVLIAAPAYAGEPCQSAKDFVNMAQGFYGDQPELKNVVSPKIKINLKGLNRYPTPSHMLYRHESVEHRLAVVDGLLTGFEAAAAWSRPRSNLTQMRLLRRRLRGLKQKLLRKTGTLQIAASALEVLYDISSEHGKPLQIDLHAGYNSRRLHRLRSDPR